MRKTKQCFRLRTILLQNITQTSCLALYEVNQITLQILAQLEVNKITSIIPFANQSIVHALYFPLFSNKKLKLDVIEWNR